MSSLGFSFIKSTESKNTEQPSKKKHCRTLRKRQTKKTSKIDNLLNSLSTTQTKMIQGYGGRTDNISERADDDDDDDGLADFTPPPLPTNNIMEDQKMNKPDNVQEDDENEEF